MEIRRITENKKRWLELLLLGDEQESMIDRYLERGEMYVLGQGDDIRAVGVVTDEGDGICELKNIAVDPAYQRRGYGRAMIEGLCAHYAGRFRAMRLGTGEVPSVLAFYCRCGFTPCGRVKDFFTDNYDHPIIEEGVLLKDMVYLEREL